MKFRLLFLTLVTLGIFSCTDDVKPENFKADSSGLRGEVLIFMDDIYWEKEAGESIRSSFGKMLYGTPQPEPILEIRNYPLKNFNRNHKANRNVVYIKFDKELNKINYQVSRDKWVKNQLYVEIKSPDVETFLEFMNTNSNALVDLFLTEERNRLMNYFSYHKNPAAIKQINDKHLISLIYPKEFQIGENKKDFVWATHERMVTREGRTFDLQEGFFVYYYPYASDSAFHIDKLIEKRNKVLKKNVIGSTDDVYMTTQMISGYEPKADTISLNGKFAVLMRGQYRMENDFMGGPFISLTTLDENNNRLVTIEGYVFAPNSPKRELIRDLEAILYSVKF